MKIIVASLIILLLPIWTHAADKITIGVAESMPSFFPSVLQRSAVSSKMMVVKMRSSGSIRLSILRDAQRQLGLVWRCRSAGLEAMSY